jgi:glycerophosphoryl diester phosphodiesterase
MGHRGSPTHITENTIPSFQKAISQGVDGLELDIRLTKDKQIAVFHDADLKRLCGKSNKINKLSLTELQTMALNKKEGQKEEVYIPSLNDLLPLFEQTKVVNIEIKSEGTFQGHQILKPLMQFLDKNNLDDKCIVSSFNPLILMKLRLRRSHTVIGFLYNPNTWFHGWDNMIWMLRVQPENLHIHYSLLNHWIVRWARKKGMLINSYTINDKKAFDSANVDGIFTDNIEYIK